MRRFRVLLILVERHDLGLRSQSIRPMPRARAQVIALIEQLDEVRASIKHLNESVEEVSKLVSTVSFFVDRWSS